MSKFYVAFDGYIPNTAPLNRAMGFIKAFQQMGVEFDVVFFMPDRKKSLADSMPGVKFHYYWKYIPIVNTKIKFLLYLFVYRYIFALKLKKGDTVLLLGCNPLVPVITHKKGVRVFQERGEHPEVVKVKLTSLQAYYRGVRRLDGMFVISRTLKDFYVELGLPEEKVHVINMTVDSSRFDGIKKTPSPDYIAYCGTASNNKDGVDELIKSFAVLHKSHPQLLLYIIGETPSRSDEAGNLRLIEDLNIKDYVVFTGVVPANEMPQILKNALVLVLDRPNSKQAYYGFPTKLGEYLLTENPVVVTRVGTIPDFLVDGDSALLSDTCNPEQFSSKISWALDNPALASQIGKKGSYVALTKFSSTIEGRKMYSHIFDK